MWQTVAEEKCLIRATAVTLFTVSSCLKKLASRMDWNAEIQKGKLKQSRYAAYGVGVALVCYVGIATTVLLMLPLS